MKITILYAFFNLLMPRDTANLPLLEVKTTHLRPFSQGQVHQTVDSLSLAVWQTQSVADILQRSSPLSIRVYGSSNGTVAARGMGASHTAILWNGINIQNAGTGSFDLTLLTLSANQQVSYKMGGGSALFGSGAVGATLFLDNEKPSQAGLHGQIGGQIGTAGFVSSQGAVRLQKSRFAAAVDWAHQSADNDFWFRNTAEIGAPLRQAQNARFHRTHITAHAFFKINERQDLQTHYWQSWSWRQATPTMTARNDHAYLRDSAQRWVTEWRYMGQKNIFKARYAHIRDKNFYASDVISNSQNGVSTDVLEIENQYFIKNKYRIRTGINITNDASNNNNLNQLPTRLRTALFVQQSLPLKWADISANVRQEWVAERLPLTFSVGFSRALTAITTQNRWILRGAFSRNYNLPSFNDLYWAGLGVPTLKAEQGYASEIGFDATFHPMGQSLSIKTTLFDIRMNNRILWLPQSDGLWRPSNVNRLTSKGVECFIKQDIKSYKALKTVLSATYTFVYARDGQGGVPLYVPAHKGSVVAEAHYKSAFLIWYQTAASRHFSASDRSAWAAAFTTSDLSLGYDYVLKMSKKDYKCRLYGRIDNLFNQDYQVIRFYPQPRRQWQIGLQGHF